MSEEAIEVYNRENRFDYIFSRDVAEGLAVLAQAEKAQGVINLGSGNARSIQDFIKILAASTGKKLKLQYKGRSGLFERSCADLARLKKATSWTPPTTLEEGVKRIVRFEQEKTAAKAGAYNG